MKTITKCIGKLIGESAIRSLKEFVYRGKGEPISYGKHHLRYMVGTRPIRLSYLNAADETTRNDVKQIKYFLDRVKLGERVFDIGGHNGQYAVLFSSLVGKDGEVVTFEPDSSARAILRRNLALNPCASNVHVEDIALSDEDGSHVFYSNEGDSMSSLVRSGLGTNATAPSVTEYRVATMRLDNYLPAKGIPNPHWIKLDTEGAEINILRGARKVLESGTRIVCELHPYAWNDFGTSFEELLGIVNDCGRKIRYLDETLKIEDGAVYGAVIIS